MRINDTIYFSTNLKLEDLNLTDKDHTLKYFKERIEDYYFKPIRKLVDNKMAFAAGALECLLIDAFARYSVINNSVGKRMIEWCEMVFKLKNKDAENFYKFFRCGLLHESHIKQFGQFCFDDNYISSAIEDKQNFLVVNPKYVLSELEKYLENFINDLNSDPIVYKIFIDRMEEDFGDEIKKASE